jgi:sugar fermentation stimulation protein A
MSRSSEGKGAALIPARFAARPNRFIVEAVLADGRQVQAHLADPGRLRELLLPGAELRLRPVAPESQRRTRYTVALVRSSEPPRVWVSVDTTLPNRLARRLLEEGRVRGAPRGWTVRPEVRHGASRFDFELRGDGGDSMLVEVKSVTLVANGVALFPDAPTVRGARHVRELAAVAGNGGRAMVLFVVQRNDARLVRPNPATDPDFALALAEARGAGVLLRAARFRLTPSGRATWLGPLPVRAGNRG